MGVFSLGIKTKIQTKIKISGKIRAILKNADTGEIVKDTGWIDNVCPIIARTSLAEIMAGINTKANPGKITYCAVGTGATTPNIYGIHLANEIARVPITTAINTDNIVEITAFFKRPEGNGNITEIGLFGEEASSTVNTGTMFQWITKSFTKNDTQTLLITSTIPIEYI